MKFYGKPLPNVEIEAYSGKLIVIEGTDGVGRSTHVALLRTWLESIGYAVLDTGMTRSVLAGRGIKNARAGHTLGRLTMQLYYATDFADRLENQMLPALHAGFIVLTDRYIYSAIARAVVRGADPEWMRAIYGIGLVPDAVFYLRLGSVEELAARVLESGRGFDYWESGMDLGLGNDYYDSFIAYQKLLLKEFDRMSGEYGFQVIDASRSIKRVENDLKRLITRVIESEPARTEAIVSVGGSPSAKENILG
ncbi:MAG: thymidylate kinase [Acidobacteria bacterium]|nr:MAG: thymidylate kinase [Acidobacteriota bacterium]PYS58634.1 MAG: thymidylate kinase [Acidobacteriota bacterium]